MAHPYRMPSLPSAAFLQIDNPYGIGRRSPVHPSIAFHQFIQSNSSNQPVNSINLSILCILSKLSIQSIRQSHHPVHPECPVRIVNQINPSIPSIHLVWLSKCRRHSLFVANSEGNRPHSVGMHPSINKVKKEMAHPYRMPSPPSTAFLQIDNPYGIGHRSPVHPSIAFHQFIQSNQPVNSSCPNCSTPFIRPSHSINSSNPINPSISSSCPSCMSCPNCQPNHPVNSSCPNCSTRPSNL